MILRTTLLAAAAVVGFAGASFAASINGAYSLTVSTIAVDTVNTGDASAIYFNGGSLTPANTLTSFAPTVGFTPNIAACFNCGTINNITGIPVTSAGTFAGMSPLFSIEGLSFDLTSLTDVRRSTADGGSSLELRGTGVYTYSGYSDTPGTFDITIQNSVGYLNFSSSASGATTSIPEPMSIALFGSSLAIIGAVRRRWVK